MEHPVLNRIHRDGFTSLGWFAPKPEDRVPHGAGFLILIGNAGPAMFRRFARDRHPARDYLDDWTRDTVDPMARELGAVALYPFDKPPYPFLTWARRGGAGHVSPLGLNIHPIYGLWHAYRAALLFPVAFDFPAPTPEAHPCKTCVGQPCLSACPVGAFDAASYDVKTCGVHLQTAEQTCMGTGCKARLACPVGRDFTYAPDQINFHMRAFLKARQHDQ
jgi:epoxyqueuosine reductase QueG